MRKINWSLLNLAFWIELVLSYLLPFHVVDNFKYQVGFPVSFLTVYEKALGVNPFASMQLNPLALLFNGIAIYLVLSLATGAYQKLKQRHQ